MSTPEVSQASPDASSKASRRAKPKPFGRVARSSVTWTYIRTYGMEILTLPATVIFAQQLTPSGPISSRRRSERS
jgi:hypothetical protein